IKRCETFPRRWRYRLECFQQSKWEAFMATRGPDTAATVRDIQGDFQELPNDLTHLAEQVTELVSQTRHQALGDVKKRIQNISNSVEAIMAKNGHEAINVVRDATNNVRDTLEEEIRSHPMTTLAVAVGVGFLFGSSWRR